MKPVVEMNGKKFKVGDIFYSFGFLRHDEKDHELLTFTKGTNLVDVGDPSRLRIIECNIAGLAITYAEVRVKFNCHLWNEDLISFKECKSFRDGADLSDMYIFDSPDEAAETLQEMLPMLSVTCKGLICADDPVRALNFLENNTGIVSDGYHTFNDLYSHRVALLANLVNAMPDISWKSRQHEDGSMFDGMFIVGMHLPTGDITYHIEESDRFGSNWELFKCEELKNAPTFDGHTPDDVVKRLRENCK